MFDFELIVPIFENENEDDESAKSFDSILTAVLLLYSRSRENEKGSRTSHLIRSSRFTEYWYLSIIILGDLLCGK